MKKKFIDVRSLSLEQIIALKTEKRESFNEAIAPVNGHDLQEVKRRLQKGEHPDRKKKIDLQQEYIDTVLKKVYENSVKEVEAEERTLAEAREIYMEANHAYLEAKKAAEKAGQNVENIKNTLDIHQKELGKIIRQIEKERDRAKLMQKKVLIHKTATLKQIIEHRDYIFVGTVTDEVALREIGCIDEALEGEVLFVDKIPEHIMEKYSSKEIESIMAYVNLVINFALENNFDTFKLLYSNKDIDILLKANGFEL